MKHAQTDGRTETQTEVTHSPILISAHLSVSTLAMAAAAAAEQHSIPALCAHRILLTPAPRSLGPTVFIFYGYTHAQTSPTASPSLARPLPLRRRDL